jgi:hypothetical protein
LLKACKEQGSQAAEDNFFQELTRQLAKIDKQFLSEATRSVAEFHRVNSGFCALLNCFRSPRYYESLSQRAYWCRKYARVNAVALRKILKKHDKLCQNVRGREFLQQCWCSSSSAEQVGLFLHSPLLDELKAIQIVLEKSAGEEKFHIKPAEKSQLTIETLRNSPVSGGPSNGEHCSTSMEQDPMSPTMSGSSSAECSFLFHFNKEFSNGLHSTTVVMEESPPGVVVDTPLKETAPIGVSHDLMDSRHLSPSVQDSRSYRDDGGGLAFVNVGEFEEEDLKCPICLDVMFRPIGLGCGHKFCQTCAFKFARKGKYSVIDSFKTNLQRIPAETPCPECRQGHVYENAVQLREVDALIRKKYPHIWRARRMEEEERIVECYAERHAAKPEFLRMMGMSPYDILNMY